MIVDRKVALVNSNNIQDRANMEMMVHLEGPIVDGFYDMALISWFRPMHPRLPLLNQPFKKPEGGYKFGMDNEHASIHLLDGKKGAELYHKLRNQEPPSDAPLHGKIFISGRYQTITEHLSWSLLAFVRIRALVYLTLDADNQPDTYMTVEYEPPESPDDEYLPHIFHAPHEECPMVLLNRAPYGKLGNPDSAILNAQDAAWLAGLKYAKKNVFIQSPTFNAVPVVEGVLNAVRRGVECTLYIDVGYNDGGEVLPGQGGINEEVSKRMFARLNEEEKERLRFYWYTGGSHRHRTITRMQSNHIDLSTGKDQIKPINASAQKRNCHVCISLYCGLLLTRNLPSRSN